MGGQRDVGVMARTGIEVKGAGSRTRTQGWHSIGNDRYKAA